MSRWHKTWCTLPDVQVLLDTDIPHCRACDTTPALDELCATVATFSPLPSLPPDEPPEELCLIWPPTVSYLETGRRRGTAHDFRSTPKDQDDATLSAIYERPLKPDEFRLLRLPATSDLNSPVHLEIEIYKDDEYPNYEATSYTWGGEDEDSTLCKPIFVGIYWDVSFQTRNCWSMLQNMRLGRGDRLLWVDAVCINQVNVTEREQQVSKMLYLYESAFQVVVYLGPDIVEPLEPHMSCQKRRGLHELPLYEPFTLLDLLKRKYFSRLWVVQELLLSRTAVMRVGITDYHVNDRTVDKITQLDRNWDWSRTPAPWLQHAARRHVNTSPFRSGLLDLLISTASCLCSDPRDRVFGLLALDGRQEDQNINLDYSLSAQHVMMGAFTHCLVNHRDLRVFWGSGGIGSWSEYRSWAPPWKSIPMFSGPEPTPAVTVDFQLSYKNAEWRDQWRESLFRQFNKKLRQNIGPPRLPLFFDCFDLVDLDHVEGLWRGDVPSLEQVRLHSIRHWPREKNGLGDLKSVSATRSGTILVELTHLFRINMRPKLVSLDQGNRMACYRLSGGDFNRRAVSQPDDGHILLITNQLANLEVLVEPGKDYVFGVENHDADPFFLILRETPKPGAFRLVAFCYEICILTMQNRSVREILYHQLQTSMGEELLTPFQPQNGGSVADTELKMLGRMFAVFHGKKQAENAVRYIYSAKSLLLNGGTDEDLWDFYARCMSEFTPEIIACDHSGHQHIEIHLMAQATHDELLFWDLDVRSVEETVEDWGHLGWQWHVSLVESPESLRQEGHGPTTWKQVLGAINRTPETFGLPDMERLRSTLVINLQVNKEAFLKHLRVTLAKVDVLRGRLSWGPDRSWTEFNRPEHGGNRAGSMGWSRFRSPNSYKQLSKHTDDFIFDGTRYIVEIM